VTDGPRIGVVTFPGSCDDRDAVWALKALGADAVRIWHAEPELPNVGAVVLPGGFSFGDYLRCGAIARFSPIMDAIVRFALDGGLVFGICTGIQVLCQARMLPGVLRPNESLSFVCEDVDVVVEHADTPFTSRCTAGQSLTIPVKHGAGNWYADDALLAELEANGQIVLRYRDGQNPNGSVANVAGVTNADRNIFGLMPHPEHAVDPLLGSGDGALLLASLIDAARLSGSVLV
jgi:phosphoribosylformylglycinamidine synthase